MARRGAHPLLSNVSVAGAGPSALCGGGQYACVAEGSFGGGSVRLEVKTPNGQWVPVQSSTLTAAGAATQVYLPEGELRANFVGGSPSGVSAWAFAIPFVE